MEQSKKNPDRKKFMWWGAAALASIAAFKFFPGRQKKQTETVKMLGQDGKLVEIDKRFLVSTGKKISNQELQKWVKK